MSSTVIYPIPDCQSFPVTRLSVLSTRPERGSARQHWIRALAFPGSGTRAGIAPIVGHENLCDEPLFTGYTWDGGFATHVVADAAYTFPLIGFDDPMSQLNPSLCGAPMDAPVIEHDARKPLL